MKAQAVGEQFEHMLKVPAQMMGATLVRMPDGCRTVRRGDALTNMRVKTPFDYILARKGQPCAFFDAKTVAGKSFSYSAINQDQVQWLRLLKHQGMCAGYVVWFRGVDRVVWYDVDQLRRLQPRESLLPSDGVQLGGAIRMDLSGIFTRPLPSGIIGQL